MGVCRYILHAVSAGIETNMTGDGGTYVAVAGDCFVTALQRQTKTV
jgi:hypothetical protein